MISEHLYRLPPYAKKIAIFDLDGVIFKSPAPIHSSRPLRHRCWDDYFNDHSSVEPNQEMVELYWDLQSNPVITPVILTARPESFREPTGMALARLGIHDPVLVMEHLAPNQEPIWNGSGEWKCAVIKLWQLTGITVLFCVEDFKPNADLIRRLCPVLLYERMKAGD